LNSYKRRNKLANEKFVLEYDKIIGYGEYENDEVNDEEDTLETKKNLLVI